MDKTKDRHFLIMFTKESLAKFYVTKDGGHPYNVNYSPLRMAYMHLHNILFVKKSVNGQYDVAYRCKEAGFVCQELKDGSDQTVQEAKSKWFDMGIIPQDGFPPMHMLVIEDKPDPYDPNYKTA